MPTADVRIKPVISGLKRFILWDYRRASWQYDVMVALILIFLFATPREWFRDQPKVPHVAEISSKPPTFWIESALVTPIPESNRLTELSAVLKTRTGKAQTVTRLEPVYDSEKELKGYMAFTKP
jgi:hypothetical protein